jgi:hypothetical protein
MEKPLSGLKAIGEYLGRSPSTIRRWIRNRGFPASWVAEWWYALPKKINTWIAAQIVQGEVEE